MKKKVYWIRKEALIEVYKYITRNDASTICQEHYQLVEQLPHVCSLTDKKPIVYWIENKECKMTDHLTELDMYEYVQLTVSNIISKAVKDILKLYSKRYENRLQKQKTDVVRGDDTERSGIQGGRNKTSTSVGHLSYKAIHS